MVLRRRRLVRGAGWLEERRRCERGTAGGRRGETYCFRPRWFWRWRGRYRDSVFMFPYASAWVSECQIGPTVEEGPARLGMGCRYCACAM